MTSSDADGFAMTVAPHWQTVSYTHLDVYKRQVRTSTSSCANPEPPSIRPGEWGFDMRIKVLGAMWQIDPLMLLFPILAALLGEGASAAALIASLFVHELAHAAAARLLHVGMSSVRLTPFGGMSRIENPYAISAPRVFAVAAAGPAANLLALLACGALFALSLIHI